MVKASRERVAGKIYSLPLSRLEVLDGYPFREPQASDDRVLDLAAQINMYDIYAPLVVHPVSSSRYALVDGYKRRVAAGLLEISEVPAVILEVGIYHARIMAIDEHIGATNLLASEKAKAYAMRYKLTSRYGFRSALKQISTLTGEKEDEVREYIALSHLTDDFMALVDAGRLSVKSGCELSALSKVNQMKIYDYLKYGHNPKSVYNARKYCNTPYVLSLEEVKHLRNKVDDVLNEGRRLSKQDIKSAFNGFD
jgi:hypothetical protein